MDSTSLAGAIFDICYIFYGELHNPGTNAVQTVTVNSFVKSHKHGTIGLYSVSMVCTCVICQSVGQGKLLWKSHWHTIGCRKSDSRYIAPYRLHRMCSAFGKLTIPGIFYHTRISWVASKHDHHHFIIYFLGYTGLACSTLGLLPCHPANSFKALKEY